MVRRNFIIGTLYIVVKFTLGRISSNAFECCLTISKHMLLPSSVDMSSIVKLTCSESMRQAEWSCEGVST